MNFITESHASLFRSIFISTFMTVAALISGYAFWQIIQLHSTSGWAGALLANLPFILMISRFMLFKDLPRTSANLPWLYVLAIAGVLLSVYASISSNESLLALAGSVCGLLGVWLYLGWYSTFGGRKRSATLKQGSHLPDFILHDLQHRPHYSGDFNGKPTLFLFYRGNWCPLCMAQIREVAEQYRQIEALGARVVLVSPQPHGYSEKLAKQFAVNFEFMVDAGNTAARTLGIDAPNGLPTGLQILGYDSETVLPTVIITDAEGRLVWKHETDNYRIRPEPALFLQVLQGNIPKSTGNGRPLSDLQSAV